MSPTTFCPYEITDAMIYYFYYINTYIHNFINAKEKQENKSTNLS